MHNRGALLKQHLYLQMLNSPPTKWPKEFLSVKATHYSWGIYTSFRYWWLMVSTMIDEDSQQTKSYSFVKQYYHEAHDGIVW